LDASGTADVVVVGLGAFGSAVLYQLACRGTRVIGIDRFEPPHTMGSSHGETRITRLAVGEGDAYAPMVRRSHEIWRELERESGEKLMTETGGLIVASRDSAARHHGRENFVQRSFTIAERFGIEHERLDAKEIVARFPQFQMRGDEVGYFEPAAGMLTPENCVRTQLRLAGKRGAVVRFNERVLEVRPDGDGVQVITDKGTIRAARCVLTAGPWLAGLMPPNLRPLVRVYRQVLHWFEPREPSHFAAGRFPIFIWMHGEKETDYFYGFPTLNSVSGVKVATETYERDIDPDRTDRGVTAGESAVMYAEHVANRLRDVTDRVLRSAACLYTVTPDSGFIVDTIPGQDRVLAISACSGHGFKHSAALGEAVAQRVAEGNSTIDLAPFALGRFDLRTTHLPTA
jgi:sarcosine oxidase